MALKTRTLRPFLSCSLSHCLSVLYRNWTWRTRERCLQRQKKHKTKPKKIQLHLVCSPDSSKLPQSNSYWCCKGKNYDQTIHTTVHSYYQLRTMTRFYHTHIHNTSCCCFFSLHISVSLLIPTENSQITFTLKEVKKKKVEVEKIYKVK